MAGDVFTAKFGIRELGCLWVDGIALVDGGTEADRCVGVLMKEGMDSLGSSSR